MQAMPAYKRASEFKKIKSQRMAEITLQWQKKQKLESPKQSKEEAIPDWFKYRNNDAVRDSQIPYEKNKTVANIIS